MNFVHKSFVPYHRYARLINLRNICIYSRKMEMAVENLEKNPYYAKYAKQISELQKEDPAEFSKRVDNAYSQHHSHAKEGGFSKVPNKSKSPLPSSAYAFAPQKKLDTIMKIDLIKDKTSDEIKYIWTQHFLYKDAISGVMSPELFEKLQDASVRYPMFIFPLPRDQGYEFIYAQFAANEIHFTSLISYQAYGANAPECLTVVHYPDLVQEKKIILMHGEFNKDVITSKEAQFLVNNVMMYYTGDDEEKISLLHTFHSSPGNFKHTDLIDQIEKFDLSSIDPKAIK